MLIFFKNYKRTDRLLLSIQSVKYLFPNIEVWCLNLYNEDVNEYSEYDNIFKDLNIKVFLSKKKYNFDKSTTSAAGSKLNGLYFTEGVNKMYEICKEYSITGKVLFLDEDSFFTTGKTIKYLQKNNFDLAYGWWDAPPQLNLPKYQPNASIVCINMDFMKNIFPIPEVEEYVEILWGFEFIGKAEKLGLYLYEIPTRKYTNYFGDGVHTNDINIIKKELSKHNIPYKL